MKDLYTFIIEKVYTDISKDSLVREFRPNIKWVMDFKGVTLNNRFLDLFCDEFGKMVLDNYKGPVQVAGMESGALPLLAALSVRFPGKINNAFYFRKSRKKHDLAKQIEGFCAENLPIIIVDDILNSGSTTLKQIKILSDMGRIPAKVFTIVRFRDEQYYSEVFGSELDVESIFELNDFTKDLNIKNIEVEIKKDYQSLFNQYEVDWKLTLSKANHYDVLPKSAPVADAERIYLGTDEGIFFAIDKETGKKIWEFKAHQSLTRKGIYSSPAMWRDYIYFGAYDGNVYCLDKHSGKSKWISFEGDFVGSSPCIANDLGIVYVGLEFGLFSKKGGVIALRADSGKVLWADRNISDFVHASPAYSSKYNLVVCGSNNGLLYAFDAKTGKRKWEFKTNGEIKYRAVFDEKRGLVAFGSFDGGLYVVRVQDGALYHKFEAQAGFYSTPIFEDGKIIIGSLDKMVYAFDVDNKTTIWTTETNGRIFSSAVIVNSLVYIGSNDGCLYILSLEKGEKISQIQLTERIVNSVIVEKESVFIPTHACELYRYDKIPE